jgi:hypothetical protein
MTEPPSPDPTGVNAEARSPRWPGRVGQAAAYLAVGGLNAIALICALFVWLAWLSGDYRTDHDMLENSGIWLTFMAVLGGGSAGLALIVAAIATRLRWTRRWTVAVSGGLLAATALAGCAVSIG